MRSWVEIQIQLSPSSARFDALGTRRADRFYRGIHSRPIVQGVQNVVHFCVPLVMYLGMRVLDERLLLFNRNDNPLPRVTIRGNSQQSMRIYILPSSANFLLYPNIFWEFSALEVAFLSKKKGEIDVASP